MWGRAFRQPSNFEYYDEFRGNTGLEPERVQSFELEQKYHPSHRWLFKTALFYSIITDDIQVVDGQYENSPRKEVGGFLLSSNWEPKAAIDLYGNVIWTQGQSNQDSWGDLEHVAAWKLNVGLNWLTLGEHLNSNIRVNFVGKTLAPKSNHYMWREHGGYAPSYTRVNLTLTLKRVLGQHFEPQLVVRNLLDRDHFTLGRQDGRSDIANWDPNSTEASSINPQGFIPAYHPQAGRTILLNMRYTF
jgi:outer membrane receptor protein involved in Fe transport